MTEQQAPMENTELKEKDQSDKGELVPQLDEEKKGEKHEDAESEIQDGLFTQVAVNELTQNQNTANVLHKILTLCSLSKTVDIKILSWVKFLETITKKEFEELSKIQKNFDFQIANRDFRNDEKLKQEFARQEGTKMTNKLTGLIDVPMIDKTLLHAQINLTDAEFNQLAPFFFPVKDIDTVAVA